MTCAAAAQATARQLLNQGKCVTITGRGENRLHQFAENAGRPDGLLRSGHGRETRATRCCRSQRGLRHLRQSRGRPANLIRASLPALKRTRGRIVLIGSVAGVIYTPGNIYGATKWAVTGLAENTRRMVTGDGDGDDLGQPWWAINQPSGVARYRRCRTARRRQPPADR